jgi:hypothetical protein
VTSPNPSEARGTEVTPALRPLWVLAIALAAVEWMLSLRWRWHGDFDRRLESRPAFARLPLKAIEHARSSLPRGRPHGNKLQRRVSNGAWGGLCCFCGAMRDTKKSKSEKSPSNHYRVD